MSQLVAQASAPRETSYGRSPGLGTHCSWIAKVARKCGALGNANGGHSSYMVIGSARDQARLRVARDFENLATTVSNTSRLSR